ncbi:class I SAM-dependent methyltransferase [Roseivirga sp.]|uniref:class I SAM-dependent methyltransferase n=1 Tax=Roseivirga sp. TaxID=1964215 RepID=UPI003B8AAE2A
MKSKALSKQFREILFRHLDGIVTAPSVYLLHEKGVLQYLLDHEKGSLTELTDHFKANEGYLNVALRVLVSQGWLKQNIETKNADVQFSVNQQSPGAFKAAFIYREVVELLKISEKFHPRKFEVEPFRVLAKIQANYQNEYPDLLDKLEVPLALKHQILSHIEGVLLGPSIVHLGMNGMFHKYFMEASFLPEEYHSDPDSFRKLLDFFTHCGWFTKKNDTFKFTDKGLFFAKRASAYGVTVSYIPTLRRLDDMIFGNPESIRTYQTHQTETHVDREMNVWGSGGAHTSYFKVVDEVIIDLFNLPIDEQPKGILDMGCGNGAFLQHMFDVIAYQTERGKLLDKHPLFLVGVDYNQAALKVTRSNLIQADIWAKVMWGDIGKPALLAEDLQTNYGIDLKDLLNVRTFLDHNRIWESPKHRTPNRKSVSTGAYAYKGRRILNEEVEDSLLEHLGKWKPFVSKFGLLVIELHTLPPHLTSSNLGRTAATAYDATHGYSDQYILESGVFMNIATEAGLPPVAQYSSKFPNSELATVTINLLKGIE